MARSHHRKKHKTQLKQFKHSHDTTATSPRSRTKASSVFAVVGSLAGFAISYFATRGALMWVALGILAGAAIGYYIGRSVDAEKG
jgi:uncharacterized membrane protein YfcA